MDDSTTRTIHDALKPVHDAYEGLAGLFESYEDAVRALRRLHTAVEAAQDELTEAKHRDARATSS